MPIQAIIIPLFFITNKIHIYDTLYGLYPGAVGVAYPGRRATDG